MAQLDLAQHQKLLREQGVPPAQKLRRQVAGMALLLLAGGGYALWHGTAAQSAPEAAAPAASPVAVVPLGSP